MASDKKKQLLFGGIGVVALVIVAAFLMKSGASDGESQKQQPDQPAVRDTGSDFDDDPGSVATRSTPTVDRSRSGRLAGASDGGSAVDEDEDENSVEKNAYWQREHSLDCWVQSLHPDSWSRTRVCLRLDIAILPV